MNPVAVSLEALNPYAWANVALAIFLFMAFIFSLLVLRQARQMTRVLPTPLSPPVQTAVVIYAIATAIAVFLAVGIVITSF